MNHLENYLGKVNALYRSGIAREHSYRGDLQTLLGSLAPDVQVTNEPARIECGAPDFIITKKDIPVGYVEAKDLGADLGSKSYKEQFDRYKSSLPNLIITNYLDFQLYRDGLLASSFSIGSIVGGSVVSQPENFENFTDHIRDFCTHVSQTINSANKLSRMMAGKARLLAKIIENALTGDESEKQDSSLKDQYKAFREILIHDIDPKGFADIYAQTIAYGMFAARLHDPTLDTFSRQEAAELIPKTNPFLRKLFQYIAGYDLDDRIRWIVDALADIFRATDVAALLKDFGKATQQNDPIIHFYETFLAEYDRKLRKSRGVWYTPEPVVNFIVRAVDDILKSEFNLSQGLADISKTTIEVDTQVIDKRTVSGYKREKQEVHKVQILDPTTGTGTFLAEVVKQIYGRFKGQQGIWSKYVEEHLVPRLNGFEILMASYAMAHLKLDLLLTETGYKAKSDQRFRVYLTNSLEEHHPDTGTLFAGWLSREASEANYIKRDTPVMVVLGNPPYAVSSSNNGDWIRRLIGDYKEGLDEKKINLDDDYIKFIRYGEHYIERNGEGVLAYISNNSFLSGVTHRNMRRRLLETFDSIYIVDLHGDSKNKEKTPSGGKDENVFDITKGVSINIFIKSKAKSKATLGKVSHVDSYGLRNEKYDFLFKNSLSSLDWKEVNYREPYYFFCPKNYDAEEEYKKGFSIKDLFLEKNTGIQTKRDALCLQENVEDLAEIKSDFLNMDSEDIRKKYNLVSDNRDWKIQYAKEDIRYNEPRVVKVLHRPFDIKFTLYTGKSKGFIGYPRHKTMKHMLSGNNYALLTGRQNKSSSIDSFFVTKEVSEMKCAERTIQSYHFPLYIIDDQGKKLSLQDRIDHNFDKCILSRIADSLELKFQCIDNSKKAYFSALDLFDYIYAILYSPSYRKAYSVFLKIDFPRIPYPKDQDTFWRLVALGAELRQMHLFENSKIEQLITTYPKDGDNTINRKISMSDFEITDHENETGRVWINNTQYFEGVPVVAWDFSIGGYQPAQKWLKDRRGRELSFDDILHYQKIIVVLRETTRIMQDIDKIDFI